MLRNHMSKAVVKILLLEDGYGRARYSLLRGDFESPSVMSHWSKALDATSRCSGKYVHIGFWQHTLSK